jgi:hypothetical protein
VLRNHLLGVKILKFFEADPGSGMKKNRIWDPGWKKLGSGNRHKQYHFLVCNMNGPLLVCKGVLRVLNFSNYFFKE